MRSVQNAAGRVVSGFTIVLVGAALLAAACVFSLTRYRLGPTLRSTPGGFSSSFNCLARSSSVRISSAGRGSRRSLLPRSAG